jgi:hypothetical protein
VDSIHELTASHHGLDIQGCLSRIMDSIHKAAGHAWIKYTRLYTDSIHEAVSLSSLTKCTRPPASQHGLNTQGYQARFKDSIKEAASHSRWTQYTRLPFSNLSTHQYTQYTRLPPHIIDPTHKAASHAFCTQYSRRPVSNHRPNPRGCQPLFMVSIHEAANLASWTQLARLAATHHRLSTRGSIHRS